MQKNMRARRERFLAAAEGYLMLEMPQHALAALDTIEDPERAPFAVNYQRGMVLRHTGQFEDALKAFDLAAAVDPDHVSLLLAMAWCYKRSDQLSKAITAMEHAYQVAPAESIILYNLACYWTLAGNKAQALTWLGRALRMDKSLRDLIPAEPDFDRLRDDPGFEMLLGIADDTTQSV